MFCIEFLYFEHMNIICLRYAKHLSRATDAQFATQYGSRFHRWQAPATPMSGHRSRRVSLYYTYGKDMLSIC